MWYFTHRERAVHLSTIIWCGQSQIHWTNRKRKLLFPPFPNSRICHLITQRPSCICVTENKSLSLSSWFWVWRFGTWGEAWQRAMINDPRVWAFSLPATWPLGAQANVPERWKGDGVWERPPPVPAWYTYSVPFLSPLSRPQICKNLRKVDSIFLWETWCELWKKKKKGRDPPSYVLIFSSSLFCRMANANSNYFCKELLGTKWRCG